MSEANDTTTAPARLKCAWPCPRLRPAEALTLDKAVRFTASGVRQFPLPPTEAGRLMIVAAEADAEIVASLEREENGRWTAIAFERGRSPALAWPADGKAGNCGSRSGQSTVVRRISRSPRRPLRLQPEEPGKVALKPVALDGLKGKYRAALVHAPLAGLINLAGMHQGLSAGATPGRTLEPANGGILIPQSEQLWFLSRGEGADALAA